MKKFLLSLVAILLVGMGMSAETTVVFDFASETYGLTRESENVAAYIENGTALTANQGVVVTLNKTDGKNGWRLWSDGLRIYKNSGTSMQLNAGSHKITGIAFEMAKANVIEGYSLNGGESVAVSTSNFTVACDAEVVDLLLTVTSYNGAIAKMTVVLDGTPGETPEIKVKEVASLTEFIEEQDLSNFIKITGEVTVTHQSADKKYTFITDGISNLEVFNYDGLPTAYKNGDRLTGIIGKFGYYKNMPQMTPQTDSFGAPTEGTPVTPAEVTLDQVGLSQYVIIKNVNIVADGTNWNVTDGTTTKQLFNRFNIDGIAALDGVTIIGIGSVYEDNAQIFPISIEGGTPGQGGGDDPDTPNTPEGGVTINATDFTIDKDNGTGTASADGYTITLAKNDASNPPAFHDKTQAIRLYAKCSLTVSGAKIAKVVFTLASDAGYKYTTFTPSVGTLNPAQAAEDTQITWEGDATEVTFTVGDKAILGSDGEGASGQIRLSYVTIYSESSAISEIRFDNDGSAVIYNLQGRRLSAPERGINIINGQKVLVK